MLRSLGDSLEVWAFLIAKLSIVYCVLRTMCHIRFLQRLCMLISVMYMMGKMPDSGQGVMGISRIAQPTCEMPRSEYKTRMARGCGRQGRGRHDECRVAVYSIHVWMDEVGVGLPMLLCNALQS